MPHCKLIPAGGACGTQDERDVRESLTAYACAGGPHHNAVCFGDARTRLAAAARLLDADYCEA